MPFSGAPSGREKELSALNSVCTLCKSSLNELNYVFYFLIVVFPAFSSPTHSCYFPRCPSSCVEGELRLLLSMTAAAATVVAASIAESVSAQQSCTNSW